jgi:hypothetical protein
MRQKRVFLPDILYRLFEINSAYNFLDKYIFVYKCKEYFRTNISEKSYKNIIKDIEFIFTENLNI